MRMALLTLMLFVLAACGSQPVTIAYRPPSAVAPPTGSQTVVAVGAFADRRTQAANELGVIRGGFGNRLKTLETPVPVRDVVSKAFADGLAARQLLGEAPRARYTLSGTVNRFDSSQMVRREAHIDVAIVLIDNDTKRTVLSMPHRRDVTSGSIMAVDVGVFASANDLAAVAADALQQVVDATLDSPEFAAALRR
jgi:ABC-type uncharacterized transport system auxiliary subunit